MSFTVSVWRGGVDDDLETTPPIDLDAAAAAFARIPGCDRIGDDEWFWEATEVLSARVIAYSPEPEQPVNELNVTVTFEPGRRSPKREALRTLGTALFETAARSDAVVGEPGERVFHVVDDYIRAALAADPWPAEPEPPKSHVTRRELFTRFLHRDED